MYITRQLLALILFAAIVALPSMAQQRPENERREKAQAEKIIAGPQIEQVTNNGATIAWTTNTGGSSVIKYGTDPSHLDRTAESPYADKEGANYQTHRVQLKNLRPDTTYYYSVVSGQGEGTGTMAQSQVQQFKTK